MRGDARSRYEGYRRGMSFTMAPAFFSTDLDRTSKFWSERGFIEARRYEGYMILEHPMGIVFNVGLDPDLVPSEKMTNAPAAPDLRVGVGRADRCSSVAVGSRIA